MVSLQGVADIISISSVLDFAFLMCQQYKQLFICLSVPVMPKPRPLDVLSSHKQQDLQVYKK